MTKALTLASLRLSPRDAADIAWLFLEARGALGLKSNLGPMIDALELGMQRHKGSKPVIAVDYDLGSHSGAVDRARRIERRLEKIDAADRRTLMAAYGTELTDVATKHWAWLLEGNRHDGITISLLLVTAERLGVGRRELRSWRPGARGSCPTGPRKGKGRRLRLVSPPGLPLSPGCGVLPNACDDTPPAARAEDSPWASVLEEPYPSPTWGRGPRQLACLCEPRCWPGARPAGPACATDPTSAPAAEDEPPAALASAPLVLTSRAPPPAPGVSGPGLPYVECWARWGSPWMDLYRLRDDADVALVQACRAYDATAWRERRERRERPHQDGFAREG